MHKGTTVQRTQVHIEQCGALVMAVAPLRSLWGLL